jgi:hypothetical protein
VFVFAEYMPPWPGDEPFSCRALGSPRALQLWIVRGERSLSRTRIATTERLGVIKRRLAEADEQVRKRKFENRA